MSEPAKQRKKKREFYASSPASSSSCSTTPRMKQAKPESVEDEKYQALRKRNNIAVRKSREKQRGKQAEVINRLSMLRDENAKLHSKVNARIRELEMLGSLLKQVNHPAPKRLAQILEAHQMHQQEGGGCLQQLSSNTEPVETILTSSFNVPYHNPEQSIQQSQYHQMSNQLPSTPTSRSQLDQYSHSRQ